MEEKRGQSQREREGGEKSKEFKLSQQAERSVNRKDGGEKRGDRQRERRGGGGVGGVCGRIKSVCLRSQHDGYRATPF